MTYTKACDCKAKSKTWALRITGSDYDPKKGKFVVSTSLIPGPSCDQCGTPWNREAL